MKYSLNENLTGAKGPLKGPLHKFIFADLFALLLALAFAFFLKFGYSIPEPNYNVYINVLFFIILGKLVFIGLLGLYDFRQIRTSLDVIYHSVWAVFLGSIWEFLLLMINRTYYHNGQPSRAVFVYNAIFCLAIVVGWRLLYLERRRKYGYDWTRMLIVGSGQLSDTIMKEISEYARFGHQAIGLVDDTFDPGRQSGDMKVLGKLSDLPRLIREYYISEIIIAAGKASRQKLIDIIAPCRATGVRVHILPELYETMLGNVKLSQVAGIPLVELPGETPGLYSSLGKRIIDISTSIFGLLIMGFLSIFLFIYNFIFDHRRPLLYIQERIGKDEKPFRMLKFRTMVPDAEKEGPVFSGHDDPRVTPMGRFLRRWNLDEIPQFWNVFVGDMSLIGPRPERPVFVEEYTKLLPAYRLRWQIKPGMTGLAQIHGFYDSWVGNKLRYDLAYIVNASFLLDIKILFMTIKETLRGSRVRNSVTESVSENTVHLHKKS